MKVKIFEDYDRLYKIFINHYDDYNIIHKSKVDDENFFIVVEKFFFRNSSRASLSIVLSNKDLYCEATIVGSGGGKGMIFKFDWGAADAFQRSILSVLTYKDIRFEVYSESK